MVQIQMKFDAENKLASLIYTIMLNNKAPECTSERLKFQNFLDGMLVHPGGLRPPSAQIIAELWLHWMRDTSGMRMLLQPAVM